MDGKTTFKYVVLYQVLAAVAALVGFAVIGLGVMMGFGDSISIVMERAPADWGDAVNAAQPGTFGIFFVLGLVVWQVGKSFALVFTMGKVSAASAGAGAGGADAEKIQSEVMDRVNDRISSVEADVKKHEQYLKNASSGGGDSSSGDRRSRRRGSAATGGDESGSSSDGESTGSGSSGGGSEASGGGSEASGSNRRSNRRAASGDDDS